MNQFRETKTFTWPKKHETIEIMINRNDYDFEKNKKKDVRIVFNIYPYEEKFFYYKEVYVWEDVDYSNSLHSIWTQTLKEIKDYIYSIKYL